MRLNTRAFLASLLALMGCGPGSGPGDQPDAGGSKRPTVIVAISSNATMVEASGQIQFTATVTGSSDSAVSWSATSGTIDKTGLFTAPTTPGEVWISATSRADFTESATTQITVIARDISSAYADKFDIIVDPYAINPLAAVANVRGLASADVRSVKVNVKGDGTSPPFAIAYDPDSQAYRMNW